MNSIARWTLAIGMSVAMAFHPQKISAEEFTGKEFLQRSISDQRGYVSTQLVMASSIAARIKPSLADCIGRTFFAEAGMSETGFNAIVAKVAEFEEYHPSSVIVVVIESRCGAFN